MKQRFIALTLFFACFSTSFAQKEYRLLMKAYHLKSYQLLDVFLENWYREVPPYSDSVINSYQKSQKETYAVCYAIFNPYQYDCPFDTSISFYKNKYIIIQKIFDHICKINSSKFIVPENKENLNRLLYSYFNTNCESIDCMMLDFKPPLPSNYKTLYLDNKYNHVLTKFLNKRNNYNRYYLRYSFLRSISNPLFYFLNNSTAYIIDGGSIQRSATYSLYFRSIIFDKNYRFAKIEMDLIQNIYAEFYLQKINEQWRVIYSSSSYYVRG